MPAPLLLDATARLNPAQQEALRLAVTTLPDEWRVLVETEDTLLDGDRFRVRILGEEFAIVAGFAGATRPEQLAAFVERTRRARQLQR